MDRRGFFLTFVFVSVLCEIVSAKGDLNDFNTDKQTISPARIAKFYSENVIQGKNIIKLPRKKGIDENIIMKAKIMQSQSKLLTLS